MKRAILAITLALMLGLALVACEADTEGDVDTQPADIDSRVDVRVNDGDTPERVNVTERVIVRDNEPDRIIVRDGEDRIIERERVVQNNTIIVNGSSGTDNNPLVAAESFIVSESTFRYADGDNLTLVDIDQDENNCRFCYTLEYRFTTEAEGYGPNLEVREEDDFDAETWHYMVLEVDNGVVVSAVTDGRFDEISEEFI